MTLPTGEYVTTKLQKQFLTGALVAATPRYINNYIVTRGHCEVMSVFLQSQNTSTESGPCDEDLMSGLRGLLCVCVYVRPP